MSKNTKSSKLDDTKTKKSSQNQAIISAAFQDHICKQLQLDSIYINPLKTTNKNSRIKTNQIKSKTDSGLRKSDDSKASFKNLYENDKEYVLQKPELFQIPTLAEKLGLVAVDSSQLRLDEEQWNEIKDKYKKREDYKEPCVICKEPLGAQQQVLLSCTHTFHRKCLEVFERFSGKMCCPMCRKQRYQARVVYDASKHYKHVCASKIQAAWRGYLVRKWYKNYRKLTPPKNPLLRKKFFEEKLSDITNRIVQSHNYEIDYLMNDIDKNIQQSRETFKMFEEKLRVMTELNWQEAYEKATRRHNDECSICMNKYETLLENTVISNDRLKINSKIKTNFKLRPIVLLSCSHVFHSVCLQTFEELNFDKLPACPECRSIYKKCELQIDK